MNSGASTGFWELIAASGLQLYQKRDSGTDIFLRILRNFFKNIFFTEQLQTTVSDDSKMQKENI